MITSPNTSAIGRGSFFKKQIPTILGLLLLVSGLAIGAFLFSQGTGVFLPRASAETTPKKVQMSNLTDTGFSVTFLTDDPTAGFVKYGTTPNKLTQQGDQRDQQSGSVDQYTLHQVTVERLQPNTEYHYVIGTGKGATFDNEGKPFTIKTAKRLTTQPKTQSVYGTATTNTGAPAEGSVVFVTPSGNAGVLSSLVSSSGSWAVTLSNARTKDGTAYAPTKPNDPLDIQLQGPLSNQTAKVSIPYKDNQSVGALKFGQVSTATANTSQPSVTSPENMPTPSASPLATASPSPLASPVLPTPGTSPLPTVSPSPSLSPLPVVSPTPSGSPTPSASPNSSANLSSLLGSPAPTSTATMPEQSTLDLTAAEKSATTVTVTTSQPTIEGKAPANTIIKIQIHSDNQIDTQVTTDATGNFELDLAALQEQLEPGEHEVTYSYVDPTTGETVTKTETFIVQPKQQLAAASASSTSATPKATPYGSSNPYPIGSTSGNLASSSGKTSSTSATPKSTKSASTSGTLMSSGSVGPTALLIVGGLFFLISGLWSWWVSREFASLDE